VKPRKRMATIRQPALYDLRKPRERGGELLDIDAALLALHVPIPQQEYLFARDIGRQWRFDYAWPALRVALEREGGTWGHQVQGVDGKAYRVVGYHGQGVGMTENAEKYNHAAAIGWCVLRVTVDMIRKRTYEESLLLALRTRGWKGAQDAATTGDESPREENRPARELHVDRPDEGHRPGDVPKARRPARKGAAPRAPRH